MKQKRVYMTISLTVEQSEWVKKKDIKLWEILDKNFVGIEEEIDNFEDIVNYYTTSTLEDYDSFAKISKMIANRRD